MFERFNEPARRALFFARYEASEHGPRRIETEHLLLGLLRAGKDGKGIVARLLERAQTSTAALREATLARLARGEKVPASVEIPFSAESKRALQYAEEEADGLRHAHIGREHLLLGVMRVQESIAASILTQHGLTIEAVRADIVALLKDGPDDDRADLDDLFNCM